MQIALIPPIPETGPFASMGDLHMLLAPLLEYDEYSAAYRRFSNEGEYLILDNGAHEARVPMSVERLFGLAAAIGAREVIMPDVPMHTDDTIHAGATAYAWLSTEAGRTTYERAGKPQLMIVPQGTSILEWERSMLVLRGMHKDLFTSEPVIGVAKNHDDAMQGGILNCVDCAIENGVAPDHIHLLGWTTDLFSLSDVALRHPDVRSVDSAKPFVYAMAGIHIDPDNPLRYPKRDGDYFLHQIPSKHRTKAISNVNVFRKFANAFPDQPLIDDA